MVAGRSGAGFSKRTNFDNAMPASHGVSVASSSQIHFVIAAETSIPESNNPVAPQMRTFRLSELTASVERMFRQFYGERTFWVIAEVTDHKLYAQKQHHYLHLVDKDDPGGAVIAKVSAVAWKEGAARIRYFESVTGQRFTDGIKVLLLVTVDYSSVWGLKLVVRDISPEYTIGALRQERLRTIERLVAEYPGDVRREGDGLGTTNKDQPLRRVLQRLAIVTSSSSAGFGDFQHTLDNNGFGYRFRIDHYFAPVQGVDNAHEICRQLDAVLESGIPYDAVIMIRGGGMQTDFLVFDDFGICARIARMHIPVITGIGHQKDESIADMVARLPLKTPTQVAEFIIGHNRRFEEEMSAFRNAIVIHTQGLLARHQAAQQHCRQVVLNNSREMILHRRSELMELSAVLTTIPSIRLRTAAGDLANLRQNLEAYTRKYLVNQKAYLGHYASVCRLMSPENILSKGFAIVYANDRIIADADGVPVPGVISIRMSGATIQAQTISKKAEPDGNEPHL
ncbi:MAG: exodeoxyribonuclease VII large subunit [Chitinophagaceae bacterium]|nr:MAG: exodeoxyribonuclease VII large subunit [Chitinophagaceae bacterium]